MRKGPASVLMFLVFAELVTRVQGLHLVSGNWLSLSFDTTASNPTFGRKILRLALVFRMMTTYRTWDPVFCAGSSLHFTYATSKILGVGAGLKNKPMVTCSAIKWTPYSVVFLSGRMALTSVFCRAELLRWQSERLIFLHNDASLFAVICRIDWGAWQC